MTSNSVGIESATPRTWIRPYYKSFNGIRGLAVLMVFFHHYGAFWHADRLQSFTWAGVDVFFVLSGFLITGILFDSIDRPLYFRDFYIRRALRIFPLYYGLFLLVFLLTPIFHLRYTHRFFSFFFYLGNLVVPLSDGRGNPTVIAMARHGGQIAIGTIGHFWSLCVEEQFYLVWPTVVWLVRDRRRLMQLCVGTSVLTLIGRILLRPHVSQTGLEHYLLHWSTYTRCDTLLIGAWLALWLRGDQFTPRRIKLTAYALVWGSAAVFGFFLWHQPSLKTVDEVVGNAFISTYGFTLIALACAGLILFALDEKGVVSRFLQLRPLSALGLISYGFYFFHLLPYPSFELLGRHFPQLMVAIPWIAFVCSLAAAVLSFHFFESPFLRLKNRLAPGHRSIPSGAEAVGIDS
jgi:peptidoglycan/LPS O-acetylase OafA/YrhL